MVVLGILVGVTLIMSAIFFLFIILPSWQQCDIRYYEEDLTYDYMEFINGTYIFINNITGVNETKTFVVDHAPRSIVIGKINKSERVNC